MGGQGCGGLVGTYSLTVLNTLLTFRSITLPKALSGCVSNFSPQVAPALAKRMSTWSVVFSTSETRRSISWIFDESAGTEYALASGDLLGRALRAAQASSQAFAFLEVM
jgi:hypothetical protein